MGSYEEFAEVTRLVAQGLPVQVDGTFDLDAYPDALARLEAGTSWARSCYPIEMAPTTADLEGTKERLRAEVEARADLLVDVSRQIHAHPS
jgi:hypothetical protein